MNLGMQYNISNYFQAMSICNKAIFLVKTDFVIIKNCIVLSVKRYIIIDIIRCAFKNATKNN